MKKLIFAAAVAAVAIFGFMAGCKNNNTSASTEAGQTDSLASRPQGAVVYVRIDSLMAKYNMALDLNSEFKTKYEKAESEIQRRQSRLERDFMDYQEKAQKGLATRLQLAEMEQKLQQQDGQLRTDAEKMMAELAEQEQVVTNRIFFSVTDYIKELNADGRYSMVISTTATGPILDADPAMDITNEVLEVLNERYENQKESTPVTE